MAEMTQGERDNLALLCGYLRGMSESGRHGFDAHEKEMLAAGSNFLATLLGCPGFEGEGPPGPVAAVVGRAVGVLAAAVTEELSYAAAWFVRLDMPVTAAAVERASAAIAEARSILAEATAISPAWLDRARSIPPPSFD